MNDGQRYLIDSKILSILEILYVAYKNVLTQSRMLLECHVLITDSDDIE